MAEARAGMSERERRRYIEQPCPACQGRGVIERVAFETESPIAPTFTYEVPTFDVETVPCSDCDGQGVLWIRHDLLTLWQASRAR